MNPDGVVTHGNLPHWYKPGFAHVVTYRLTGTIPAARVAAWRRQREDALRRGLPQGVTAMERRVKLHKMFFTRYDRYLAEHCRDRWLADRAVAAMIRENLYHHHGTKYELLAWCIMPNHVHVLLQPFLLSNDAGSVVNVDDAASVVCPRHARPHVAPIDDEVGDASSPLSRIMHSLKSYTANQANRILSRSGRFWQRESYGHWVRDLDELERIVAYIARNPVEAGLCVRPQNWEYSSACDRFRRDRSTSGFVGVLRDDWLR